MPLSLAQTIESLKHVRFPLSAGEKIPSKAMDVCGKLVELSELKLRKKRGGEDVLVADMVLGDDSGVTFTCAVWEQSTYDRLKDVPKGSGLSLISCNAYRDPQSQTFKINCWPSVFVVLGGEQAETLTAIPDDVVAQSRMATSAYTPMLAPIDVTDKDAVPTCAAALAAIPRDATDFPTETVFQLNRGAVQAPIREDEITTKNGGHLWVPVTVRDWTGSVVVYVQDQAGPVLYGCATAGEVLEKAKAGTLKAEGCRFNMRGMVRIDDGQVRIIVSQMSPSPKKFRISRAAMLTTKGMATVGSGAAQVAPVERVRSDPMQGLCVLSDRLVGEPELIPCRNIYLLVTGSEGTGLDAMHPDVTDLEEQAYRVTSQNVKCLLNEDADMRIDLTCYCDFHNMLTYRLDQDSALVSITEVTGKEGRLEAAVEFIDKVSSQELEEVKRSMTLEWQTALTNIGSNTDDSFETPVKKRYWTEPPRKVRRVHSDPASPKRIA